MRTKPIYGQYSAGVCWSDWFLSLSRYDDGSWLIVVGPFGLLRRGSVYRHPH